MATDRISQQLEANLEIRRILGWLATGRLTRDQAITLLEPFILTSRSTTGATDLVDNTLRQVVAQQGPAAPSGPVAPTADVSGTPGTAGGFAQPGTLSAAAQALQDEALAPIGDIRAATLGQQEAVSGGLGDVFGQFLAGRPFGDVSAAAGGALRGLSDLAQSAFATRPITQSADPLTFRDFLASGAGGTINPAAIQGRLSDIGSLFNAPPGLLSDLEEARRDLFKGNAFAFNTALAPALQQISPFFRNAAARQALNRFNQFQGSTPDVPFITDIARRGGNIFGAFV
jgi:hypothetical protein